MKKTTQLASAGLGLILAGSFGFVHSYAATGESEPPASPDVAVNVTTDPKPVDNNKVEEGSQAESKGAAGVEGSEEAVGGSDAESAANGNVADGEVSNPSESSSTEKEVSNPSESSSTEGDAKSTSTDEPTEPAPTNRPLYPAPTTEPSAESTAVAPSAESTAAAPVDETPAPSAEPIVSEEAAAAPEAASTQAPVTSEGAQAPASVAEAAPAEPAEPANVSAAPVALEPVLYVPAYRPVPPVSSGMVLAGEDGETNLEIDNSGSFSLSYELPMPQGPITGALGAPVIGDAVSIVAPGAEIVNAPEVNSEVGQAMGLNKTTYSNPAYSLARTGSVAQYIILASVSTLIIGVGLLAGSVLARRRNQAAGEE